MLALPVATTLLLAKNDNSLFAPGKRAQSASPAPEGTARIANPPAAERIVVPKEESNALIGDQTWMPAAVAVWGFGVVLMLLRAMLGISAIRQIRRSATGDLPMHVSQLVSQLCEQMQIDRVPAVLQSARITVPLIVGFLRPVVLMPVSLIIGMPSDQLRALIAHELAHLRRLDHLVNWIQLGIEALLFYHPAMWWVSRCVRRERENCCDDIVIRVCGNPADYAKALFTLELRREEMAFALGANGDSIRERIERFLNSSKRDRSSVALMLGVVAITILLLLPGSLNGPLTKVPLLRLDRPRSPIPSSPLIVRSCLITTQQHPNHFYPAIPSGWPFFLTISRRRAVCWKRIPRLFPETSGRKRSRTSILSILRAFRWCRPRVPDIWRWSSCPWNTAPMSTPRPHTKSNASSPLHLDTPWRGKTMRWRISC